MKENDRQKLKDFLLANVWGPFGNRVRFELVDLAAKDRNETQTLGTHGFIKGARLFIARAVAKGDGAMENYGYCMKKSILAATHLGLGTCWLGAPSTGAPRLQESTKGMMKSSPPSPRRVSADRKSMMDIAVRFLAKSNTRKAWEGLTRV